MLVSCIYTYLQINVFVFDQKKIICIEGKIFECSGIRIRF